MATTSTVADIVAHFVRTHWGRRTLVQLADELKRATGSGSDTAISAWMRGIRIPRQSLVRALRRVVGCTHPLYGDEAIAHAYAQAAMASSHVRSAVDTSRRLPAEAPDQQTTHRIQPPQQFLVGRSSEISYFTALCHGASHENLVNIYGPGGIGKSAVFRQFIAAGPGQECLLGYADIATVRYAGSNTRPSAAELIRELASTMDHRALAGIRARLHEHDLATTAVANAGGASNFFGSDGRPTAQTAPYTETAPVRIRALLRDRYTFERYLRQSTELLTSELCSNLAAAADTLSSVVLLLDTYEEIAELDDWVCKELVPRLPERSKLLILGRGILTRTNIDWLEYRDTLSIRPLPELSEAEAKQYLRHHGLTDTDSLRSVYTVTGGYPLLLVLAQALAAESGGWEMINDLQHDRDRDHIAGQLLDRLLRERRVSVVRQVLEWCSLAPWINPDVIHVLLDVSEGDAQRLYTELQTHSFVTRHPRGVVLHDKIRELLQARLRFAGESQHADLTKKLVEYLAARGGKTGD